MKKFTLLLLSLVFALSTIALAACKHEHEFAMSLTAGDTSHYYVCECGEKKDEASHVFDNACDTTCSTCGKTRSTSRSYASTLTAGETTHYYACACGAKKDEVEHVFAEVKNDTTFVSETVITATYKKSCTCGKLSNETFTVDKANSFESALDFDCQTAQSYTANMVAGQKVYVKINGAGSTLYDFYFKATTGSTATFTWEYYDATDITTPEAVESTATDTAFVDIYYTEDCYLVVTCVTGGEVSITSSL